MQAAIPLPAFADEPDPARRAKLVAAGQVLAKVLARRPRFQGMEIHVLTKAMPGRVVADVTWQGRRCFLKLLVGHHAEAAIREMQAELAFAEANMKPGGACRVARALDAAPRLGLIVLEAAPGLRMDDAVEAAGPRRRRKLHRQAGDWLAWYCAPRRETRAFDPERFLADHRSRSRLPAYVVELAAEDRARVAALADYVEQRARRLARTSVSIAASHGDFLPRNVNVSGDVVTAFDIEGLRRIAVACDAARFLVHEQMRQDRVFGDPTCGIAGADWTAFLASGVLGPEEQEAMMPLYVAQQMQMELPSLCFRPNWQNRLRRSIDAFLLCPEAR